MKNLVDDGSTLPAQRSLETGDELNEANLEEAFQSSADRARWAALKIIGLENLTMGTGVEKIRTVATLAALKALPSPDNGEIALFFSGNYPRLFMFKVQASPPSQIDGFLYPADDGTGFWASDLWYLTTGSGASLRLDPAVLPVPNRIVADDFQGWTTAVTSMVFDGSGNYDTSFASTNLSDLQQGDHVTVEFSASSLEPDNANGASIVLMYSIDGGSSFSEIATSTTTVTLDPLPATRRNIPVSTMARYNIGVGVTQVQFKLRGKGGTGYSATLRGPLRMHVTAIRP